MNASLKELMTKADLAEYLQVSAETISTNCSREPSAVPPFFKLGDKPNSPIRFRRSDVDAWIDEQVQRQSKKSAEQAPQSLAGLAARLAK